MRPQQHFYVRLLCPKKGVWNFQALKTPAFIEAGELQTPFFGQSWQASMEDGEAAIRPGKDRDQAPHRHAAGAAALAGRLALLIKHLPGERTALVPAHPLRPCQNRLAFRVRSQDRMLALAGAAWRANG